jgi:hypothetical protein
MFIFVRRIDYFTPTQPPLVSSEGPVGIEMKVVVTTNLHSQTVREQYAKLPLLFFSPFCF